MTDLAVGILVSEIKEQAGRLGLVNKLRPATVFIDSPDVRDALVLMDGDIDPVPAMSLIGPLGADRRVQVLFVEPHGAYVIGTAAAAGIEGTSWHYVGAIGEPAFNTGWSSSGAGGAEFARFRHTGGDEVALSGVVERAPGSGVVIFTLPDGFRPRREVVHFVASSSTGEHLQILATGEVQVRSASLPTITHLFLDGVRFAVT